MESVLIPKIKDGSKQALADLEELSAKEIPQDSESISYANYGRLLAGYN